MLNLRINNHSIELRPRTPLRYTLDNPIFTSDGLARGFSYPFRIPATPGNLRALGYANRLDIRDKTRKYAGQLYVDGILLESGIVQITGGGRDNIELVFKNTERDLIDELAQIRIRWTRSASSWDWLRVGGPTRLGTMPRRCCRGSTGAL